MDIMFKRISWRVVIAVTVLLATAGLFVNYFVGHPTVKQKLTQLSPEVLAGLLLLYFVFVGTLGLVNTATVRLCKARISANESLLLSMYSSIINFFGPLQSGPAFRGLYLKKKHGIKLAAYTRASFVFYFFYAFFSGLLLVSGILKWWTLALAATTLAGLWLFTKSRFATAKGFSKLSLENWYLMALASFAQVATLALIFYLELHTVAPQTGFIQAMVYTGAANFALFVSLTPGAIGFRESFLLFSQNLHHIDNATIVAANAIDRAVYIHLLAILALVIFGSHAHSRLVAATVKE
jgi:uncharacterized membrane protein YbhN (UPF0104 family)